MFEVVDEDKEDEGKEEQSHTEERGSTSNPKALAFTPARATKP